MVWVFSLLFPTEDFWWDGWMASSTQWTWVWVNSRSSRWWTRRPGVLQSTGSQIVRHDRVTELTDCKLKCFDSFSASRYRLPAHFYILKTLVGFKLEKPAMTCSKPFCLSVASFQIIKNASCLSTDERLALGAHYGSIDLSPVLPGIFRFIPSPLPGDKIILRTKGCTCSKTTLGFSEHYL